MDNSDKKTTSEAVKNVIPEWAKDFILKKDKVHCCGMDFEYAELSEGVVDRHKTPTMFATGNYHFLSITENYPAEYKEFALMHEAMEFNGFFPEGEEQCLCALKKELSIVEETDVDMPKYVEFRKGFFKTILDFYEPHKDDPTMSLFIAKLKKSYDYLVLLSQELGEGK